MNLLTLCVCTGSDRLRLRGWRSPPVNGSLKAAWIDNPPASLPQPLDHRGEGLDQGTLHGRVAGVDLPQVLVVQQVVRQLLRVAQALQISLVIMVIMRKAGWCWFERMLTMMIKQINMFFLVQQWKVKSCEWKWKLFGKWKYTRYNLSDDVLRAFCRLISIKNCSRFVFQIILQSVSQGKRAQAHL